LRSDTKLELKGHKRGANPKKTFDSTVGYSDVLDRLGLDLMSMSPLPLSLGPEPNSEANERHR
jgi:hypothetical protein